MFVVCMDPDTIDLNMVVWKNSVCINYIVQPNNQASNIVKALHKMDPEAIVTFVYEKPVNYGYAADKVKLMDNQVSAMITLLKNIFGKDKVIIRFYTPANAKKNVPKHIALQRIINFMTEDMTKISNKCIRNHPESHPDILDCMYLYLLHTGVIKPGGVIAGA